ncbi:MAG TPA: hypothetical protein VF647_19130 [Longimicrobium sp.]
MWIRIRVAGTVEVKADPEWVRKFCNPGPPSECPPPYDGASVGPLGVQAGLQVQVAMHNAYYMWTPQSGDGATAEDVMWVSAGTPVLVGRSGLYDLGDCYACTHDPDRAGHYLLSGGQTVIVEEFNPLSVRADQEQVDPATRVNFTATGPGALSGLRWVFVEGDTLPTGTASASRAPRALLSTSVTSPNWSALSECEGKTTCTMSVTKSGRMRARGIMDNNVVDALSQVVKVTPPSLTLSCVPSRLPRGITTTCTAAAQPSSATFVVESFSFAGDSGAAASQAGDVKSWSFQPLQGGSVTVRGKVAGVDLSASTRLNVCDFFKEPPGDPTLQRPGVQQILLDLAKQTNFDGPLSTRYEHGGLIAEKDGKVEYFPSTAGAPDGCQLAYYQDEDVHYKNNAYQILARVHSHPTAYNGQVANPGTCTQFPASSFPNVAYQDGPSSLDLGPWKDGSKDYPGYVVDPRHIHRWERKSPSGGTPVKTTLHLNSGANRCVTGTSH